MTQDEQVLVVERSMLDGVGMFQGLTLDAAPYLECIFRRGVARFMPRQRAETDPAYKQLIPYVIMTAGDSILTYVRGQRAGEARLVGRRSVGIGGHINPVDDHPLFATDFGDTYRAAVEREVAEEVSVQAGHADAIVALLNDDSTEVGRVHLGIVHLWRLDSPAVSKREQMITQMAFTPLDQVVAARETCETWSQLCIDRFTELTHRHAAICAGSG